jgi:uncharacterized cupredoxin-like copper-binding protein/mono/diheme cytochrome c family protein
MRTEGGNRHARVSWRTRLAVGLCAAACLVAWGTLSASGMVAHKAVTPKVVKVKVTAGKPSELAFTLSTKKVAAPGTVTFLVTNMGRLPHTFEICSSPKGGSANSCKGKVTPSLAHGKSATLTVKLIKGQYEYLCTVPGHAAAGMKGLIGVGVTPTPAPVGSGGSGSTGTGTSGGSTGGSTGGSGSTGGTTAPPATAALIGDPNAGRTVFTSSANPPCASCHTLAAAGATGTAGPNLDSLAPDQNTVVTAVTYGLPGGMPAFGQTGGLNSTQINNVAAFVYQSTHH